MKDRAREFQEREARRTDEGRIGRSVRAACLALSSAWMAGCALSVPMGNGLPEDVPTGTIKTAEHPSPFSSRMDREDWRRARSALETALDPQGNGARVAWENPESGAKGSFVPLAQVYPKGEGICRSFAARLELKSEAEKVMHASACRVNSGDWAVGHIVAVADAETKPPRKSDNLAERDTGTQLK